MKIRILYKYMALIALLILCACGYKPTFMVSSIFPSSSVTLGIRTITNPTLITTLPYHLRSSMYNSITNKKIAVWRLDSPMQYEMAVEIVSYRTTPRTIVEDDVVLLYNASLELSVTIYDARTGELFWRSGTITTEHTYNTFADDIVVPDITLRAVDNIIDAMQTQF